MKNTKTSNLTHSTKKKEGFRVMIKQRHNHRLQVDEGKGHYGQLSKSVQIDWKHMNDVENYNEIKKYVKNRMRTQCGNKSALSRLSSAEKMLERDQKSVSNSRTNTRQNRGGESKMEESLSASRFNLDKSGENSTGRQMESGNKVEEVATLEVLEKKIQELLDKRLSVCVQFKKERDTALELELESMVNALKGMKKEDPEAIESEIVYLDRKIKLFQKLMAENMTESQIMKRYFLAKVSSRPQHRRYHTELYTTAHMLSTRRFCESPPLRESVVNSSMTRQVYKAPVATAYNIFRYSNKFFNADRHKQPLPRSSYNREFLVNPQTRDKTIVPVDNIFMGKTTSAKFLSSSYQADFIPKQVEKINIKELDACRDKIKSFAVEYGRRDRSSLSPNSYSVFLEKRIGEEKTRAVVERPTVSYKKLLSESRREYRKNEGKGISSEIKHENLQKLKYRYLKQFNI